MPELLPGWYPDPAPYAPPGQQRYWDGSEWRPQVRAGGLQEVVSGTSPAPLTVPTDSLVEPFVAAPPTRYVAPLSAVGPPARSGLRAWPLWAKIALPTLAVLGVGGFAAAVSPGEATTPTTRAPAVTATAVGPATTAAATSAAPTAVPARASAPTAPVTSTTPTVQVATTPSTAAPSTTRPATPTTAAPVAVPAGSALDPRYPTCREAKSHGLGPYYRGRDPEYDWYRDADSDGIVCE